MSAPSPASALPPPATPAAFAPPHRRRVLAAVLLVPVLVALALWAFAWPAARTAPRDLPLGVAGPPAATARIERGLAQHDGAFEIHRYADEAAARDAVEDRTVYGAVVVTDHGPRLLTASAAGPAVAELLRQAVDRRALADGTPPPTVDVVAAPDADPRGAALGASVLPLALAGVAAGTAVVLLGLRGVRAVAVLAVTAILVGAVAAGLAHSWLGVVTGNWWAVAGVFALSALAVGAALAGLGALFGRPGVGLGALVVVLLGNPFSGAAAAPELLPEPVGALGRWLPPGAGVSLLRSVSFFDGAGAAGPALTLTWWAVLGLGAVLAGGALRARSAPSAGARRGPAPAA